MISSRRQFFRRALAGAGVAATSADLAAADSRPEHAAAQIHATRASHPAPPPRTAATPVAIETPDVPRLVPSIENGVKVFHLVAEPVESELAAGRTISAWGYNGSVPGPTIEAVQGDRVRIVVDNHLPEPTSMHWHGLEIPIAMDGMGGISQPLIQPGGRFVYEFTLHQAGTFFYHTHTAMQEMIGLIGLFILYPNDAFEPRVDHDFGLILQEWAVLPSNNVPNTMAMEFNWLTLNGKAGPATTPLVVKLGDRVRIRLVNMGMDHHPIHLHGHTFHVTGTEGGRLPQAAWTPGNTVLVGVAQAREIEFEANNPGDWMLHCHMPHHMMNQMVPMVGPMMAPGAMMGQGGGQMPGMTHEQMQSAGNPWKVPGFPQDVMMMQMGEPPAKPETWGLKPGWSDNVMGMMTLLRVMSAEGYEEVVRRRRAAAESAATG